jgi:hypothetical protein
MADSPDLWSRRSFLISESFVVTNPQCYVPADLERPRSGSSRMRPLLRWERDQGKTLDMIKLKPYVNETSR